MDYENPLGNEKYTVLQQHRSAQSSNEF